MSRMTLAEIMGRRSKRNKQLALIVSCLIAAYDHRDRPGAKDLFHEALAAGRRMLADPRQDAAPMMGLPTDEVSRRSSQNALISAERTGNVEAL